MVNFLLELALKLLSDTTVGIAVYFAVQAVAKIKTKRRPSNEEQAAFSDVLKVEEKDV